MSQKHVMDYTTGNVTKICILVSGTKAVLSLYNIESTVHCVMYIIWLQLYVLCTLYGYNYMCNVHYMVTIICVMYIIWLQLYV